MRALSFFVTFIAVAVIVTVAAVTAAFMIWSVMPSQPSTVTALFTLFILAPGAGVAVGLYAAIVAVRKRPTGSKGVHFAAGWIFVRAWPAALTGFLAGFGGTRAAIDLTFSQRWENPTSAPAWLPFAPSAAGVLLAILLALLVGRHLSRS